MYLVHDSELGYYVFIDDDPRAGGFAGEVVEGVTLEVDELEVTTWNHGSTQPEQVLCVAQDDPKKYKVFRHKAAAGYHLVGADYYWDTTWTHYQLVKSGR